MLVALVIVVIVLAICLAALAAVALVLLDRASRRSADISRDTSQTIAEVSTGAQNVIRDVMRPADPAPALTPDQIAAILEPYVLGDTPSGEPELDPPWWENRDEDGNIILEERDVVGGLRPGEPIHPNLPREDAFPDVPPPIPGGSLHWPAFPFVPDVAPVDGLIGEHSDG